jgi:hypothetical protein
MEKVSLKRLNSFRIKSVGEVVGDEEVVAARIGREDEVEEASVECTPDCGLVVALEGATAAVGGWGKLAVRLVVERWPSADSGEAAALGAAPGEAGPPALLVACCWSCCNLSCFTHSTSW